MGRALASPAASIADSPAAPRTPTSCRQSSDQHRTAVPPPACLNPQSEPHVVPSRRVPRPSSLALARVRQRLSHCRIFTPAQPNHSVASSEGFLLRRLQPFLSPEISITPRLSRFTSPRSVQASFCVGYAPQKTLKFFTGQLQYTPSG